LPTAKQLVGFAHDTPASLTAPPVGFGLEISDQLVPFHLMTDGRPTPPSSRTPTAKQLARLLHEALANEPDPAIPLGTTRQLEPFQCSINIRLSPAVFTYWPTAKQLVLVAHDTPWREFWPARESAGRGLALIVHSGAAPAAVAPTTIASAISTGSQSRVPPRRESIRVNRARRAPHR
jgi:hypothetical protein